MRVLMPTSHGVPDMAGCITAPVSGLILVVIWLVRRTAIFLIAASWPTLDMKSPMTAQRLPASSPVLGKAMANRVEMESTTIRPVSEGGKDEDWCVRRANR